VVSASILNAQDLQPLIQLDGVGKSFGPNVVLNGVDFDLRPGEVHALCGENGAGKSTCLGLLYGLHQPSKGTVVPRTGRRC
jgi:ribose transport system ATP-binding protein